MPQIPRAGGIVFNPKGEVLVITNQLNRRTFPKGRQEAGEAIIDTARREIREESGLTDLTIHRELGVLVRLGYTAEKTDKPSVTKHIHFFFCTTNQFELDPQEPDSLAAEWVSQDKIASVLSWPEEVDFFERHRTKLKP